MMMAYFAVLWAENESDTSLPMGSRRKWLWLTALTFGLSLTHHRTSIFMGLAVLVFILVVNHRVLLNRKQRAGLCWPASWLLCCCTCTFLCVASA